MKLAELMALAKRLERMEGAVCERLLVLLPALVDATESEQEFQTRARREFEASPDRIVVVQQRSVCGPWSQETKDRVQRGEYRWRDAA